MVEKQRVNWQEKDGKGTKSKLAKEGWYRNKEQIGKRRMVKEQRANWQEKDGRETKSNLAREGW